MTKTIQKKEESNPEGRPPKWSNVEELSGLIDKYFDSTKKEEWTITGLAMALDTTRQTLVNYEKKDEFLDTIKRAKLIVENGYEIDLKKFGRSGTIFALKNFDWKDKIETDITTKGEAVTTTPEILKRLDEMEAQIKKEMSE